MENSNRRVVNILIGTAGIALCACGILMPAPEGILADESISMLGLMNGTESRVMLIVPAVLMLLAYILLLADELRIVTLIFAAVGACVLGMTDINFSINNQAYTGILINEIGIVLMILAAMLQAFATEKGAKLTASSGEPEPEVQPQIVRDMYYTDAVDAQVIRHEEDDILADIYAELGGSSDTDKNTPVTIEKQPEKHIQLNEAQAVTQSAPKVQSKETHTDFYAGIEELFMDNTQNGDGRNE